MAEPSKTKQNQGWDGVRRGNAANELNIPRNPY
jgi:hypothetical protein